MSELETAIHDENRHNMEEELGDLLFSVVNLGRFLKFSSDEALRKTVEKFIARFRNMEEIMNNRGLSLSILTLDEMEKLWQRSKKP